MKNIHYRDRRRPGSPVPRLIPYGYDESGNMCMMMFNGKTMISMGPVKYPKIVEQYPIVEMR